MVVTIDNVLTADELAAIRGQLASATWATGISAGAQAALVKHNQQLPEDAPELPTMRTTVMRALNRSPLLLSAALPYKILPPNFNRYSGKTNAYGAHVDSTVRYLSDGSVLRTDLSATLFLSEPEEYEGGNSPSKTFMVSNASNSGLAVSSSIHLARCIKSFQSPGARGSRATCSCKVW